MKTIMLAGRFVTSVLCTLMLSGLMPARGQKSPTSFLADADKADVLESALQLQLQAQRSEFGNVRDLSSDNLKFIDPARLSRLGFVLLDAEQLRARARNNVIDYLRLRTIYPKDGKVIVTLSVVREGRPCFAPYFSSEQSFAYEYGKQSGKWAGKLAGILVPLHLGKQPGSQARGEGTFESFYWLRSKVH